MNPPIAIWGAMIGVCLAIGLLNIGIWSRGRSGRVSALDYLFLGITASAVACVGYFEIRLMTLESAAEATAVLRRAHAVVFVMFVALMAFVHVHLGTSRRWLLGAALAARLGVLVANFAGDGNIQFLATNSLRTVPFLGGQVTVPGQVVQNPWAALLLLALVLFVAYVADAAVTLRRRGDARDRGRAAVIGGSVVFATTLSTVVSTLKGFDLLQWPYFVTPAFLFIVLAVGWGMVTHILDTAELSEKLRTARAQLQDAEQRLRGATQAARLGIWEWDRARREFHLSASAADILDLPPTDTAPAATLLGRIVAEDRAALESAIEQAATGVAELDQEVRLMHPDGRRRWVVLRGSRYLADPEGAPLLRGVLADVTDRQEQDERLRAVANASPIGMVMVDGDGRIAFTNERFDAVFGYERGELLGKPIDLLVPATLRGFHAEHRGRRAAPGERGAMQRGRDVVGLGKSGNEVVVEVSLVSIELGGHPVTIASVIDQTWRRGAEHQLAVQRDELTHLSRASLLGELSGSLAHELNQPLTAILSNAQAAQQLAQQGRLDPETRDDILVDIVGDTRRAGDVIHRLRTLLRQGRSSIERVDLETVVQEVLRLMSSDLIRRRVTVQTAFAAELPRVLADRVQLQQVVLNLLMNACEATDDGAYHQAWVGTEMDAQGWLRFYVVDEGSGIPEDKLERIFDPFVTTKADGLGLGLSLCKNIIEHLGGRIAASNNATVGATLEFRLRPAPEQGR